MTLLQADELRVTLGGRAILDRVGFAVAAGEIVGLIGPNGAGKTTLLRALAGLQKLGGGRVALAGRPLATVPAAERAKLLAYMAQAADCHWPVSVRRLVALGRLPHLSPWTGPGPADARAIAAALQATDMTAFAARPVTELSAGEQVRAMLARALAVEPEVLLADEPVAALDPYHQLQVMQLLQDRAAAGHAVVVVLHDLTLAARFCHRLVLLANGRVLAEGPPRAVLTAERLRTAYGVRAQILEIEGGLAIVPWQRLDPGAAA